MTHEYADAATKTLTKAIPTVDADGKVIKWEIEVQYSLNDYVSTFVTLVDVEPIKEPSAFTKSELFDMVDTHRLNVTYDSQYQSVKLAPAPTTETLSDFDVEALA